ncbi:MAG: hypothetical protein NTX59_09445 [Elusimicrobia bacterium]|nr:hypothetical protein [Elusimicrobiota bacterium]
MAIRIQEVKTKKDLKKFILFPGTLYKNNPCWVPALFFDELATLDPQKNPAFEFCKAVYFLAYDGDKIVGRIAGIINNRYIEIWKNAYARFGWVDFIDDTRVSAALFQAVENWSKEHGMKGVQGPMGFTDFDREGLLIEGFDRLGTLPTIYNFPYYPEHIEKLGYAKEVDWIDFKITLPKEMHPKIIRIANFAERRLKLHVIHLKKAKDLMPYAKEVFKLLNDGYKDLFGFVPLTDKQVDVYIKQYFSFVNPAFIQLVVDKDNKLAAVGITMPSLSKALQRAQGKLLPFGFIHILRALKKNDTVDLYLITVRKDLQGKGVNAIIMREAQLAYLKHGVTTLDAAPELETNTKIHEQWQYFDHIIDKKRRCYTRSIP